MIIEAGSVNDLFIAACAAVSQHGDCVSPRGLGTTELLGVQLRLVDPRSRFLDLPLQRTLNPAFAVAEALWILSGSDQGWIFGYNDALRQYTDAGVLQGAYGPRMRGWPLRQAASPGGPEGTGPEGHLDQLDHVRRLLVRDPASRQAVIQLFDPGRDAEGFRDVPCTLNYRFYLRRGRLHMHTTMRSQDLWLGFGYDIFTATWLQQLLAHWLGAELGPYNHYIDSLHLYDNHRDAATAVAAVPTTGSAVVDTPLVAWEDFDTQLRAVLRATQPPGVEAGRIGSSSEAIPEKQEPEQTSWGDTEKILRSYRLWKTGDHTAARAEIAGRSGALCQALQRWYRRIDGARPGTDRTSQTQPTDRAGQHLPAAAGAAQ